MKHFESIFWIAWVLGIFLALVWAGWIKRRWRQADEETQRILDRSAELRRSILRDGKHDPAKAEQMVRALWWEARERRKRGLRPRR